MKSPRHRVTRPAPAPTLAALSALLLAVSAQATLIDSVVVNLVAPAGIEGDATQFTLSQAAPLATGIRALNLGGSGAISSFMLDNEQISFNGNSIRIRVGAGSIDGLHAGYGTGAHYDLTGLGVLGFLITGMNVYGFDGYATSGFTGLAAGLVAGSFAHLNAGFDTLSLDLDNALTFADRGLGGSQNYAEFRIDLLTQPVAPPPPPPPPPPPGPPGAIPEPGTLALLGAAGLGFALTRRRQDDRGG